MKVVQIFCLPKFLTPPTSTPVRAYICFLLKDGAETHTHTQRHGLSHLNMFCNSIVEYFGKIFRVHDFFQAVNVLGSH